MAGVMTHDSFRGNLLSLVLVGVLVVPPAAFASDRRAQVHDIKGDVRVSGPGSATAAASLNLSLEEGSTVQTGADSWLELRFNNLGLARIGPGSLFSFRDGSRRMTLKEGSVILQIPRGAHGARIEGGGDVAVVAGTTALFECHPSVFKFLVLEGTVRFFRPGHLGDSILLPPGRMIIGQPGAALSDPVDFDILRFMKSSRFITDFQPLESGERIAQQVQKQEHEKAKGTLRSTNLAIFGGGTSVSVLGPATSPSPGESPGGASPPPLQSRDVAPPPVERIPSSR
jgi:hypothetical protein